MVMRRGKLWLTVKLMRCLSSVWLLCEVGSLKSLRWTNDGEMWYMIVLGLGVVPLLQNTLWMIVLLAVISDSVCAAGMLRRRTVLEYRNLCIDDCSIVCLLVSCEHGAGLVFPSRNL